MLTLQGIMERGPALASVLGNKGQALYTMKLGT